eukprot:scaffold2844_cov123-Cylindrotheca_fusiformis.AAC.3
MVTMDPSDMSLLQRTQALIKAERTLTAAIEKVEPWLVSNTLKKSAITDYMGTRVRPIPSTMEEVHQILAVGRTLASRTSAPAGWNPAAPVVGFSTPNPLPHQLRGGALAALQLDRARQAESDKKRRRQEEEALEQKAAKKQAEEEAQSKNEQQDEQSNKPKVQTQRSQMNRRVPAPHTPAQPTTDSNMNLSDSSSSEEGSSSEGED